MTFMGSWDAEKRLGFGCMRLPMLGGPEGEVDQEQFNRMIDRYMQAGFFYFDTAHVYLGGKSELALREGLVKRYPRESYFFTDKLSGSQFSSEEEIRPFFEKQRKFTGLDWFDLYLMHGLNAEGYRQFVRCRAFEVVQELKAQGLVRHIGLSFHDKPAVLETILTEHPEIEAVQIQLNYADIDSPSIESGAVYEVCRKFHKPVLVMEPVKGGVLAALPETAARELAALGGSPASYALRYAASFEGVAMVLSGMSTDEQMEENLRVMADFSPLNEAERAAVDRVRVILHGEDAVACTACRYCVPGCPRSIPIPDLFACLNSRRRYHDWGSGAYYDASVAGRGRASDCVQCGRCEKICPQHLPIRALLEQAAAMFDGERETPAELKESRKGAGKERA